MKIWKGSNFMLFNTFEYIFYIFLLLKVLYSDKLIWDGQIFQVWPYLNSLIIIKLPFSQQEHIQIFPSLSPSIMCFSLWFRIRERPKKYLVLSMYTHRIYTHIIFWAVILVSILMLWVYLTFSLFFKIWLTESILISRE